MDRETKEPIEGAAVLVVFNTVSATLGGAVYHYADAIETVTDRNGEFKLPAHRIISPGVLRRWDEDESITIFKPGYGCYPAHPDVSVGETGVTFRRNQLVTVELPKLKTREERVQNYGCYPSESVLKEKYAILFQLIQQERAALGLESRSMTDKQGRRQNE